MAQPLRSDRRFLTVLLTLLLLLGSVGRGLVAAADAAPATGAAGWLGPVCHVQAGEDRFPGGPDAPAGHPCCDDCALGAAVALPAAPAFSLPAPTALANAIGPRVAAEPSLRPVRTPRLSQGPPAA
jgi:hypothetical protein